jgi:predicted NBD/HSP70 family sugar kinase
MPKPAPKPSPVKRASHGTLCLPGVVIASYSTELRDENDGLIGDLASQTAFRALLQKWRKRLARNGSDALADSPKRRLTKRDIDRLLESGDPEVAAVIRVAAEEFAQNLARVAGEFLQLHSWRGVQRIVVGGGFVRSSVGRMALRRAGQLLKQQGHPEVSLRRLHHEPDDGGLIGSLFLVPRRIFNDGAAMLAIDIGGTNVRCGIVLPRPELAPGFARARVVRREKWRHADDVTRRRELVEGIVGTLQSLVEHAGRRGIALVPWVGVACPGHVLPDGRIERGAQNLPGDWEGTGFNLPERLRERLRINGRKPHVVMHNDAVVQGLSEWPFMQDVRRWAVFTIGTGLGNASYANRGRPAPPAPATGSAGKPPGPASPGR